MSRNHINIVIKLYNYDLIKISNLLKIIFTTDLSVSCVLYTSIPSPIYVNIPVT